MSPDTRVAVVGLGYVGLPLAIAFAEAGHLVHGIDVSADRVAQLNARQSPIDDVTDERLAAALESGNLCVIAQPEAALAEMDAVFVCVPTPITTTKDPDLGAVLAAAAFIRDQLRAGQLIILQSTTFPGTTTGPFRTVLEASGLVAGRDFDLAFAPERVNPGDPASAARTVPRLVGGVDAGGDGPAPPRCSRRINDRVIQLSSPDAAEMAKLLENTFRNVNIAFVNQLALLCERMGLDVWEIIDAAATKPFGFMRFTPGPGVGGHCIPLDPYYLSWRAREFDFTDRFIELAGDINVAMPRHVVDLIAEALNDRGRALSGCEGRHPRRRVQAERPGRPQLAGGGRDRADSRRGARRSPTTIRTSPRSRTSRASSARTGTWTTCWAGPTRSSCSSATGRSTGSASTATGAWSSTPSTARTTARRASARCSASGPAGRTGPDPATPSGASFMTLWHCGAEMTHSQPDGGVRGAHDPALTASETAGRRPRIAYLSFSTGEYDARTFRMARSALDAGYDVVMYSRWHAGQPPVEELDGYRLVRAPFSWRLIVPGLRGPARRKIRREMADAARVHAARQHEPGGGETPRARPVAATTLDPQTPPDPAATPDPALTRRGREPAARRRRDGRGRDGRRHGRADRRAPGRPSARSRSASSATRSVSPVGSPGR